MQPKTLSLDQVMKLAPPEERIYRHRCVERWSIVVPWIGFSLSTLLKQVQPTGKAKYVAFETYYDPKAMLSPREAGIPFPYVEGLRLDEAMHPLAMLSFGMYGETMPNQNGAPIRLVIPWKYGYKSIKSIARIRFVEKEPPTDWNLYSSREYGFYSNVNPEVDHPRWSQKEEQRLGSGFPGARHAHGDGQVQRLRRSGRQPVQRHGPGEIPLAARWPGQQYRKHESIPLQSLD